jgi:hypothetical protein
MVSLLEESLVTPGFSLVYSEPQSLSPRKLDQSQGDLTAHDVERSANVDAGALQIAAAPWPSA